MTDTPELERKSCPFCGETVRVDTLRSPFLCYGCGAQGPDRDDIDSDLEDWNTRTTPAGDAALREAADLFYSEVAFAINHWIGGPDDAYERLVKQAEAFRTALNNTDKENGDG